MSEELKSSAQKVQDFLDSKGHDFVVREFSASTRTAADAAAAIGCEVGQIANSLIFRDKKSGEPVLILSSGANRVSMKKVKAVTGLTLGRADADFVREHTGFVIGGVPPVAHPTPLRTLFDVDLDQYDVIWAAAGTPNAVFQIRPADLFAITGGEKVDVAE